MCEGFAEVAVFPSPKVHKYEPTEKLDEEFAAIWLVKVEAVPAQTIALFTVNNGLDVVMCIVEVAVSEQPDVLLWAIRVTR